MKKALFSIGILWFSSLIGAGFAFFTQVILARELGPADFGLFAVVFSIVNLLVPLAIFGIPKYWLKEYGLYGWAAKRYIPPSLMLVVITTFFAILFINLWAFLGPHDDLLKYVLIIAAFYVAGQVAVELVMGKLQLEERYIALAMLQLIPHLIRFLLIFLLAFFTLEWLNILNVVMVFSMVSGILVAFSIYPLRQLLLGRFDLKGHENTEQSGNEFETISMANIMQKAWPFGLSGVFHLIYFQSDIILVKYIIGDEAAGLYNVAFMILVVALMFPSVVYQRFLLPKIHRWANQDKTLFYKVYKQGNLVMLGLGLFGMLLAWWLAPYGIPILFGEHYQQSIDLFMILALSIPILFVASSVGATLVTQEHMKTKVKLMGLVAIVNILLNVLFIPKYGATGAAVATVISNLVLVMLFYITANKVVFVSQN
jgi:O-antigen/teichoic acid export membrane protein